MQYLSKKTLSYIQLIQQLQIEKEKSGKVSKLTTYKEKRLKYNYKHFLKGIIYFIDLLKLKDFNKLNIKYNKTK